MKYSVAFRKNIAHDFTRLAVITLFLVGGYSTGCTGTQVNSAARRNCMAELSQIIREAPEKKYLHTLDGRNVRLEEFFNQCEKNSPNCILFPKFYYWQNEVIGVVSQTENGPQEHKVRAYYNPLSICHPERTHPGRTHGDVAEFYNQRGDFMGLAVYMGQGQYFLLYYDGYQRSRIDP